MVNALGRHFDRLAAKHERQTAIGKAIRSRERADDGQRLREHLANAVRSAAGGTF
jgi:hypothetical protein